jgi:hypothetical protein
VAYLEEGAIKVKIIRVRKAILGAGNDFHRSVVAKGDDFGSLLGGGISSLITSTEKPHRFQVLLCRYIARRKGG